MNYIETFDALSSTTKRTDKINILQGSDILTQEILLAAYHPLKHYNLVKVTTLGSGASTLMDTWDVWRLILEQLENRTLSGNAARSRVKTFIHSLSFEDGEIFKRILKKDLRCGAAASTINLALPGLIPIFGCMRAKKFEQDSLVRPMYMSLKLDGLRGVFKDGALYTRNGHKIQGVSHIEEALTSKGYTSADGEIMTPNLHFQDSSGNIRSHNESKDAVLHVFDLPSHNGSFSGRLVALKKMEVDFKDIKCVEFVKHVLVSTITKVHDTFDKALAAGYEGLMLKTTDHKYQVKRSGDWRKIKVENSKDLKTIGFFEGTGKYADSLGGIIVDFNGVPVRAGSGFSDQERKGIWANRDFYLGKTAEIKYHEVTPDGSLRHPIFKCFRVDK